MCKEKYCCRNTSHCHQSILTPIFKYLNRTVLLWHYMFFTTFQPHTLLIVAKYAHQTSMMLFQSGLEGEDDILIETRNHLYQHNIGQRVGLSFLTSKFINFAYCNGKHLTRFNKTLSNGEEKI